MHQPHALADISSIHLLLKGDGLLWTAGQSWMIDFLLLAISSERVLPAPTVEFILGMACMAG